MARGPGVPIRVRSRWLLFGLALATVVLVTPVGTAVARQPVPVPYWGPGSTHLSHIITVVMENRDYDTYFGTYCRSLGPYCSSTGNGIPAGTCVPYVPTDPAQGCVTPFDFNGANLSTNDLEHDWISGAIARDGGAMDGFYAAENSGVEPFGHYNGTTIPIYWDLAEEYALGDNLFGGDLSYSLPNHWDLLGGAAPNVSEDTYVASPADHHTYLAESNATPTVQDLLNGSGVSWKYYDWSLWPYANAVHYTNVVGDGSAYNFWNPMAARAESYADAYASHFVPRSTFFDDAQNGTLPQLAWVIPDWGFSDHAPANVTAGQAWVARLVNAVEASPEWSSSAIFIVWDDYGGFYDHVAPPRVLGQLLGFRSPAIVIGPYVKENYIGHRFLDFYSLLHLAEWRFGLGCLTGRDCTAPLPFDFFNFNQTARTPWFFPTSWASAVYPMPLQGHGGPDTVCLDCRAPVVANLSGHLLGSLRIVDPS